MYAGHSEGHIVTLSGKTSIMCQFYNKISIWMLPEVGSSVGIWGDDVFTTDVTQAEIMFTDNLMYSSFIQALCSLFTLCHFILMKLPQVI